ncbi:ADP-ribosylglycohydrolase family protein [Zhongshania borealis]|uniref:ADP-ribosylglycohydrolase n=1 Tax=Zhongshania borealis TaxID=889488 RepID=A0ABP7W610_9GAMM
MDEQMIELLGGLLAGDLIGSAYEGMAGEGGRQFVISDSRLTDDSVMAMVTARLVLAESSDLTAADFADGYRECITASADKCSGFSPDMLMWATGSVEGGCMEGNGAGVRAAAIALVASTPNDIDRLVDMAVRPTHSIETMGMALILANVISELRLGVPAIEVRTALSVQLPMIDLYEPELFRSQSMDTTLWWTLPAALHIGLTASSYRALFKEVLFIGGDTDSIGAMAGAVGHARWGLRTMPRTVFGYLKGECNGPFACS